MAVETEGNRSLVFLAFHGPSFPQRLPVSLSPTDGRPEVAFGLLHVTSRLSVGLSSRQLLQFGHRETWAQEGFAGGQFREDLPWRDPAAVDALALVGKTAWQ